MNTVWRIELLGGLRAIRGDQVVTRFRTYKTSALLAYLAYHPHQIHDKETLIELLWPDDDVGASRQSLSMALSSLRRQFEPPGIPRGAVLQVTRSGVRLSADAVLTDVREFEAALARTGPGQNTPEQARLLAETVALYRGPLLPGFYEDWVLRERDRLAELNFQALRQLVSCYRHLGDSRRAVDAAYRAVATDSLREEAHQQLIELYLASGQPAEALRQYAELEALLRRELDAAPSPSTQALIARSDTQHPRPALEGGPATRSGSAPADAPPPAPLAGVITELLIDLTPVLTGGRARGGRHPRAAELLAALRSELDRHPADRAREHEGSFRLAFRHVEDAASCAVACHRVVGAALRIALHTGDTREGERESGRPRGELAAALLAAAHRGQVLCSETTAALLRRSAGSELRVLDLGLYRLRAPARIERVFEVEYPRMSPGPFRSAAAEPGRSTNLPSQFTRFFGREKELERLRDLLAVGIETGEPKTAARLITLVGPGGAGKTRLALEAAGRCGPPVAGLWFVPLADISTGEQIGGAILDAIRVARWPGSAPLDQALEALAHAPALLILDGFEALVPEGLPVIRELLDRAPMLACLVTSRRRLGLSGERVVEVRPLPVPRATEAVTPERLARSASVQLFVDRAQAVQPDFQVTPANADAVAALCRRLEGIPLALELAAGRAAVRSPRQMLADLEKRLDLLQSHRPDVLPRHRTLRAAMDWSIRLLSPELQRFYSGLAVFRAGWTLEAAEAVAAGGEEPEKGSALDALAQLREFSLIYTELTDAEVRFRVLETLREFALERLTGAEKAAAQQRHAGHFLRFSEDRIRRIRTSEEPMALGQLEADLENVRAAMDWSESAREWPLCARLALALARFLQRRGYQHEALQRVRTGLRAAEALGEEAALTAAELHREYASLHLDQFRWAEAREQARRALDLFVGRADAQGAAHARNLLGLAATGERAFDAARTEFRAALEQFRQLDDPVGVAIVRSNLGLLESEDPHGDREAAARHWQDSQAIYGDLDYPRGMAEVLTNLGALAQEQGDLEPALRYYRDALRVEQEQRYPFGVGRALSNLGEVALLREEPEQAARLLTAAVCLFEQCGSPYRRHASSLLESCRTSAARLPSPSCEELRSQPIDDLIGWATGDGEGG